LWAVALWGPADVFLDGPAVRSLLDRSGGWPADRVGRQQQVDLLPALPLLPDSAGEEVGGRRGEDRIASFLSVQTGHRLDRPLFLEDSLARQVAIGRLGSVPLSGWQPLGAWVGIAAGAAVAWPGIGTSFAALGAWNSQEAGRSWGMLAAAAGSSTTAGGATLSFSCFTGQLTIQPPSGGQMVQESVTAGGFVDVILNGQHHSSNPSAASYDQALAGATVNTVTGMRFAGRSADTLLLGSQQLAGGLMVQAGGATVITQDIVTSGTLAIQAANITVRGVLQGSSVALVASGWVTVNAVARINAAQAASGGLAVAANTIVNSGQLHADGPSGGQVLVRAGNILNAGPITADGTSAGGSGGQLQIAFTGAYIATTAAVVSANSTAGPGGQVLLDGASTARLYSSGRQLATGSVGGMVTLLGRDIVLAGATVSASGQNDGGLVRIAGPAHIKPY
jgi:hypothetical protein